ncbi:Uncharacterised protein [uncultured archaeon]|nr:Uncharacterised protein [uncultured archaeon]
MVLSARRFLTPVFKAAVITALASVSLGLTHGFISSERADNRARSREFEYYRKNGWSQFTEVARQALIHERLAREDPKYARLLLSVKQGNESMNDVASEMEERARHNPHLDDIKQAAADHAKLFEVHEEYELPGWRHKQTVGAHPEAVERLLFHYYLSANDPAYRERVNSVKAKLVAGEDYEKELAELNEYQDALDRVARFKGESDTREKMENQPALLKARADAKTAAVEIGRAYDHLHARFQADPTAFRQGFERGTKEGASVGLLGFGIAAGAGALRRRKERKAEAKPRE